MSGRDWMNALVMVICAPIPGVSLYFLSGGAIWAAVLSGVLAIPFGVAGGFLSDAILEYRAKP